MLGGQAGVEAVPTGSLMVVRKPMSNEPASEIMITSEICSIPDWVIEATLYTVR